MQRERQRAGVARLRLRALGAQRVQQQGERAAPQLRRRVEAVGAAARGRRRQQEPRGRPGLGAEDVGLGRREGAAGAVHDDVGALLSTATPRLRRPAANASVSPASSAPRSTERPDASPASSSARLVTLFDPGTRTAASSPGRTGRIARALSGPDVMAPDDTAAAARPRRATAARRPRTGLTAWIWPGWSLLENAGMPSAPFSTALCTSAASPAGDLGGVLVAAAALGVQIAAPSAEPVAGALRGRRGGGRAPWSRAPWSPSSVAAGDEGGRQNDRERGEDRRGVACALHCVEGAWAAPAGVCILDRPATGARGAEVNRRGAWYSS